MSPSFEIFTQRLHLRLIQPDYADELSTTVSQSKSLHQWIDWCEPSFTHKDAEQFILATRLNWVKGTAYGFGVFRKSDDKLIGMVAINELYHTFNMASLGYWVSDAYQGEGYAKEAFNALVEFCFSKLNLTRLEVVCDPDNQPSLKLATACGAEYEVTAKIAICLTENPEQEWSFLLSLNNHPPCKSRVKNSDLKNAP